MTLVPVSRPAPPPTTWGIQGSGLPYSGPR